MSDDQRPQAIEVRGARVHNLKNIDIDIPLGELVGVAGVSGSGKSSLALGVLYAEGSRRYLEALSTYTRRRLTQASRAQVDEVLHVPAALALHQRPTVPGIRSTFGTMTELLNSLRLLFSRVASHVCPHCGARNESTLNVAAGLPITCAGCGKEFHAPGAESLAFNSAGACPTCSGTGIVREVNRAALVPDESKSIDDGAVLPWGSLMWDLMKQVCGAMGVRTNVPFSELTPEERDIVFNGPAVKKHILYKPKKGDDFAELDFTYFNAVYTVENALAKAKDEKGLKRVARFLKEGPCADCGGTRLSAAARAPHVRGLNLAEASAMTLDAAVDWVRGVPESLSADMRPMATNICESFLDVARRLLDLGLGYLALDRAGATLSTGERQRVQLARAVRNRTTGVLYVLDEPSIGLHPSNVDGLLGVMHDLVADGNSVVVVDHDVRVLKAADHLIEMGPVAGAEGGHVIAQGTVGEVAANPSSRIAPFLADNVSARIRERVAEPQVFDLGRIRMTTSQLHTVKPLDVDIPRGRLVAVTGVSGSGKSFSAKKEMVSLALSTQDDIIVIDPESEYRPLIEGLGGQVINISATSPNHINAMDMEQGYGDGENPVVLKSEFLLSLCEQLIGAGKLSAKEKSVIDRCTAQVYRDYIRSGYHGAVPTLQDFHAELLRQPEKEAQDVALAIELFTDGSLNTFAKHTNVDTNARILCYDIRDLGKQLLPVGMLVVLDSIFNRIIRNRGLKRNTWIYIDEIYLLFQHEYSANFLFTLWKRMRKYQACGTGISQNIEDLLQSHTARTMLANSEFLIMLNQAATDREELARLLNISDNQLSYITNVDSGRGLIKCGSAIVPFVDHFPKNKLYQMMTTKPSDLAS